jgi:hypothetical protein
VNSAVWLDAHQLDDTFRVFKTFRPERDRKVMVAQLTRTVTSNRWHFVYECVVR